MKDIKLLELGGAHYYQVGDKIFPSVTTILKSFPKGEAFEIWLKQNGMLADTIRDEAGRVGTRTHKILERLMKGEKLQAKDFPEKEWKFACRAIDFFKGHRQFKVVASEIPIYHPIFNFAGTIDLVAEMDGVLWLIDFKTSKQVQDTYHMQISAYVWALNHMIANKELDDSVLKLLEGKSIDKAGILILDSRTQKGYSFVETTDIQDNFDNFLKVYEVWKFMHPDLPEEKSPLPNELELQPFNTF